MKNLLLYPSLSLMFSKSTRDRDRDIPLMSDIKKYMNIETIIRLMDFFFQGAFVILKHEALK